MSAVLIADGDAARAKRLEQALVALGLETRSAPHGAAALEAALGEVPDVVVAPFDLPLIDATRLADILRANPRTKAVRFLLLGRPLPGASQPGVGDEIVSDELEPREIARRVEGMLSRLARIDEVEQQADDGAEVQGKLSKIALSDLLQLFNVNQKTGALELSRGEASSRPELGVIHLDQGQIVQAATGHVQGEKALFRLLAWSDGAFAFTPKKVDVAPEIQKPLRALLMEGMRQLDESNRARGKLPPLDAHVALRVKSGELPNMVHPLTQEVLLLLEIYTRVQDVVDHCSFPDYQVLRTLHTLVERGMVEIRRHAQAGPAGGSRGLFVATQARRLREWLQGFQGTGPPRDAKLNLVAVSPGATADFVRLLRGITGIRLAGPFAAGSFSPDDLAPVGRIPVDAEIGLELVHVPASAPYAPLWPLAGHGALGSLVLLEAPVATSLAAVAPALAALRACPRPRIFHVLLLRKGERALPDELRDHPELLDEASLFLVPLESGKEPGEVLRALLARVVP